MGKPKNKNKFCSKIPDLTTNISLVGLILTYFDLYYQKIESLGFDQDQQIFSHV